MITTSTKSIPRTPQTRQVLTPINTSKPRRYHALGFNVIALHGKKPLAAWKSDPDWTQQRQTLTDVDRLNWPKANRIAAVCGSISGDLRCIDFDKQPNRAAVDQFLAALGLPLDYPWCEPTPSGGYHVWLISHNLIAPVDQRGGKVDRAGRLAGHIELRCEGVLTNLYLELIPSSPPATISAGQLVTAYELVTVKPAPDVLKNVETSRRPDRPSSRAGSWDAYLRDEFEPRIPSAWLNGARNSKGFHKNVPCPNPQHEDRNPSFGYNPESHTGYCFVCGPLSLDSLADLIGAPRYERPDITHPNASAEKQSPAPDLLYDQPRDPDVRVAPWKLTDRYRALLLNLHNEFSDTYEDLGDLVLVLDRVILPAESRRLIERGALLAEKDLIDLNARLGFPLGEGYVRGTIQRALEQGQRVGAFALKSPRINTLNSLGDFTSKGQPTRKSGQRGPSKLYLLRDQDIFNAFLVACLSHNALRAAHYAPPGDPFFAPDELRAGEDYGLSEAEAAAANVGRAPLLEQYAAERDRAQRKLESAARVLAQRLADTCQAANQLAAALPEGTPTPNRIAYRTALLGMRHESRGGIMVEPNRVRIAAVGFRNENQLRLAREKLDIKTDKRYRKHAINRDLPVLDQLNITRPWGWRLEASNGATFEITRRDMEFVESWSARQFEAGATITALEQVASRWRDATPDEKRQAQARQEARREKQRERREQHKVLGPISAASRPRADETPLDRLPRRYTLKQVTFGLDRYTDFELRGDVLENRTTGETISQPTIRDLALAWKKESPPVEIAEGVEMSTFTSFAEPPELTAPDVEQARDGQQDAPPPRPPEPFPAYRTVDQLSIRRPTSAELRALAAVTAEEVAGHTCECCGQPAQIQHFTGWYCPTCYALPLADKMNRWRARPPILGRPAVRNVYLGDAAR